VLTHLAESDRGTTWASAAREFTQEHLSHSD
jgi:hypothetical protein